jgi:hypothetical protein
LTGVAGGNALIAPGGSVVNDLTGVAGGNALIAPGGSVANDLTGVAGDNALIAPGSGSTSCTGSQTPCCSGGTRSCCSKNALPEGQSYDVSCWSSVVLPNVGEAGRPDLDINPEPRTLPCISIKVPTGHTLPMTAVGQQVSIGCFTYSCTSNNGWETSSSDCECQPNATYYAPCGDCGTKTRVCSTDGTFPETDSPCEE